AVVREALSNVARHAKASRTTVDVEVDATAVTVRVTDNGIGPPTGDNGFGPPTGDNGIGPPTGYVGSAARDHATAGHGLTNLRRRAEGHGGTFRLSRADSGGTVLLWTVPLGD